MINTLLFDLDGTFLDTAPDFLVALNRVRTEHGHPALLLEQVRPWVSYGSKTLLAQCFPLDPEHPTFSDIQTQFLGYYRDCLGQNAPPFEGLLELLADWEAKGHRWGIVTNKAGWLTQPLLERTGFWDKAHVVVSGDTTPHTKPHPYPLQYACEQLQVLPSQCAYVGDALRDIQAGQQAGMKTIAALYGYILPSDDPNTWHADHQITHLNQLGDHLK